MVEYWEDILEDNPKGLREAAKDEFGELVYENTGDDFVDKWEQEIAQGLTPDLSEALPADFEYKKSPKLKKQDLEPNIVDPDLFKPLNFEEMNRRPGATVEKSIMNKRRK